MWRKTLMAVALVAVLAMGIKVWYRFYRDVPQPQWITADQRNDFLYGAVGAEDTPGLPYWIWLALPRMFPEYMPGPGGYASLVIFNSALQFHRRDPQHAFTQQRMKDLEAWLNAQRH